MVRFSRRGSEIREIWNSDRKIEFQANEDGKAYL